MRLFMCLLVIAILLGAACCLATCRKEQTAGQIELTMFDWPFASVMKLNRERIPLFEQQNPGIKVRIVSGAEDKYLTMVVGGLAPDVTVSDVEVIGYYAKCGTIMAIDDLIEEDKKFSLDQFFPNTLDGVRYKGGIYGLPDGGSPVVVFYNKEMFDEYNSEHPDEPLVYPSDSEKWDWDAFRRAAKSLTKDIDGDGRTDVYGTTLGFYRNRFPIPVWQNGGEVISADKKRCLMDSPEAIAGIRWLYEMMWVDHSAPTAFTQIEGVSEQTGSIYFQEQRIAMMMTTRYAYSDLLEKTDFEWDIGPLPRGPVSRTSLYIGGAWLISSRTSHREEAWRLVKFLTGKVSSEMNMKAGRGLTANRIVAEKMLRRPGTIPPHDYFWIDAMNDCRSKDFEFRQMGRYFNKATDEIQTYVPRNKRTPEEACRNFTRYFQEGLDILWKEEGGP